MRGLSGAALAGGRSVRMGRDKAWVLLGGRPLIAIVVGALGEFCDEVFVSSKDAGRFQRLSLRAVSDLPGSDGPLAGIAAALEGARHERVFICGCDMPFVNARFATELAARLGNCDAVAPVRGGRAEPMHAVWSTAALASVRRALASGERSPGRLLDQLETRWVPESDWREWDPEGRSLWNINTPADLEWAQAVVGLV